MNKVLLVGNGFDLAHGLWTSYNDFLFLMKNWNEFEYEYEEEKRNIEKSKDKVNKSVSSEKDIFELFDFIIDEEKESEIKKFIKNIVGMDRALLDKLKKIIDTNSWVNYFINCGAEIDGWIDFEKEIYPVIEMFTYVFKSDCNIEVDREHDYIEGKIKKNNCDFRISRLFQLWNKYIWNKDQQYIAIESIFLSEQYGVLKKKILKSLKEEFDEFICAFEIYIHEFVFKRKDLKLLKQIKDINADYVISFNYTLTEKLYEISEQKTHHIHGKIREDLARGTNNMVLGVNGQKDQIFDFIYFVKYFQRIQKRTGIKYKGLLKECGYNSKGWMIDNKGYELHIYGHSLDTTDEDILKYIMVASKKIYIYYYTQEDYESKVINLIALYGREELEENMDNGRFEFVPTSNEKV